MTAQQESSGGRLTSYTRLETGTIKQVVINADDFGLSSGVNRAVVDCFEQGVLTSTSLVVNLPGFEDAVNLCKSHPGLGVGVHMNILRGRPVCKPEQVPSLVDGTGRFWGSPLVLYRRFLAKRISFQEVERELDAQIARARDAGIGVTHLDSEKHTHLLLPGLARPVCQAAARFGIRWVRRVRESVGLKGIIRRQARKALLLNMAGGRMSKLWAENGLAATDCSAGVATAPLDTEAYLAIFDSIRVGVTEILCHPGFADGADRVEDVGPMYADRFWEQERAALLDGRLREAVDRKEIHLTHFGRL